MGIVQSTEFDNINITALGSGEAIFSDGDNVHPTGVLMSMFYITPDGGIGTTFTWNRGDADPETFFNTWNGNGKISFVVQSIVLTTGECQDQVYPSSCFCAANILSCTDANDDGVLDTGCFCPPVMSGCASYCHVTTGTELGTFGMFEGTCSAGPWAMRRLSFFYKAICE